MICDLLFFRTHGRLFTFFALELSDYYSVNLQLTGKGDVA